MAYLSAGHPPYDGLVVDRKARRLDPPMTETVMLVLLGLMVVLVALLISLVASRIGKALSLLLVLRKLLAIDYAAVLDLPVLVGTAILVVGAKCLLLINFLGTFVDPMMNPALLSMGWLIMIPMLHATGLLPMTVLLTKPCPKAMVPFLMFMSDVIVIQVVPLTITPVLLLIMGIRELCVLIICMFSLQAIGLNIPLTKLQPLLTTSIEIVIAASLVGTISLCVSTLISLVGMPATTGLM